ncbi:hypothetical protein [uncultured Oscillibacter sp.]|uniref:hypothetical protein n=1 Tax=uncultured Oscillibacter sp. TaxID=876091 RepID=UPI002634AACA|nr:hypothetical protein [uncultured Oscillibacter sp.]
MTDYTGWIVRASAGRDVEGLFCVVGSDPAGLLLIADGKRRKMVRPKRKKLGHVELLTDGFDHPAIHTLKQGEALSDKALRRALAAFRDQLEV